MTDTTIFKFVGENINKTFNSIDDAKEYVKDKIPADGKTWHIEEVRTIINKHYFKSVKQTHDNPEITKKIVEYFLEHANENNVKIDSSYQYFINPEHRYFRYHDMLYSYLCAKEYKLVDNTEEYHKLYNELYDKYKDKGGYEAYNGNIAKMICLLALKDKYNIDDKDLWHCDKWGYINKDYYNAKYPALIPEINHWMNDMYYADGGSYEGYCKQYGFDTPPNIWRRPSNKEVLEIYKDILLNIPIEKLSWEYNIGDYKPCHNYKLVIHNNYNWDKDHFIHMFGCNIPGIMFRNEDIYITTSNYIGRHVNHRMTKAVNVDEKLYEYCIKNLK